MYKFHKCASFTYHSFSHTLNPSLQNNEKVWKFLSTSKKNLGASGLSLTARGSDIPWQGRIQDFL